MIYAQKMHMVILADATSIMGMRFGSMKLHPLRLSVVTERNVFAKGILAKAVFQDNTQQGAKMPTVMNVQMRNHALVLHVQKLDQHHIMIVKLGHCVMLGKA